MKKFPARLTFYLLNLLAAILLVCVIGYFVLSHLESYTQHGQFIPVPAFNDLTVEEAHAVARHAHLTVVVTDSLYDDAAKPGVVLEQSPVAGAHVKENRLIHLIINAHNPEKVVFPNLQNAAYLLTLQTLTSRGFKIGHIEYAPSEFHNLVLDLKHD